MDYEKYQYYYRETSKMMTNPDVALAIERQTKLSQDAYEKLKIRNDLEDKLCELYHSIHIPNIDVSLFGGQDLPEHQRLIMLAEMWAKNDPKLDFVKDAMVDSGLDGKIGELEVKLGQAMFDYFDAFIKLDTAINDSREKLFSNEYKAKLKEYADEGVLLYFLETPDAPLLSEGISINDFLESLTFGNCLSLKGIFASFVNRTDLSPSMKRKRDDIVSVVKCLENGEYRTAARTVFALLESEHKNCSKAMDNYFKLDAEIRNGLERSKQIQCLLDGLKEQTYFSKVWDIVNPLYRDILNSKAKSFIDRNSIVHGDYYSDELDISEKDVVKLLLLFANMRMISDHIQSYCEMLRESINYTVIHFAQQLKSKTI